MTASVRPELTARVWSELAMPTAAQFVDWFLEQSREGQEWLAGVMLEDAARAARCVTHDHDGALAGLEAALLHRVTAEGLVERDQAQFDAGVVEGKRQAAVALAVAFEERFGRPL